MSFLKPTDGEEGVGRAKKEKKKIEIKEYGKGDPSTASIQSLAVSFSSILQYPSTLICLFIRNSMASLKLTMANPHKAIACCPWCLPLLQLLLGTITIITTYAMAWQCLNNSLAKKRVWEKWSTHSWPMRDEALPSPSIKCPFFLIWLKDVCHRATTQHNTMPSLFPCCTPIWDISFSWSSPFEPNKKKMYSTSIFRRR